MSDPGPADRFLDEHPPDENQTVSFQRHFFHTEDSASLEGDLTNAAHDNLAADMDESLHGNFMNTDDENLEGLDLVQECRRLRAEVQRLRQEVTALRHQLQQAHTDVHRKYRKVIPESEIDVLIKGFFTQKCRVTPQEPGNELKANELYEAFQQYCIRTNLDCRISLKMFAMRFYKLHSAAGGGKRDTAKAKMYTHLECVMIAKKDAAAATTTTTTTATTTAGPADDPSEVYSDLLLPDQ
eukprot:TRINITY_DN11514_c1_g1_i1.p1 TRINITY_DN11514_c1_g1~~TRINITY_DN11514_c1_g1_i1.p1  ORF type:complete len:240 (-),score=36.73 TRINITY_DN11514_c1_g1_i1:29-748(-)